MAVSTVHIRLSTPGLSTKLQELGPPQCPARHADEQRDTHKRLQLPRGPGSRWAAEWLRGGQGPEPERRSVHVRASGGRMAVLGFSSAVRAAPWLWRRAAAELPRRCPGKGYTVGPAQVRTVQVSRSAELVVRPETTGGRSCWPSASTVRGLLGNGLDNAADLKCARFLS